MESLSKKESILLTTAVLVGGLIFLYFNLFYLPNIPLQLNGNGSTYLFNARRMLGGEMVYRDFFQHTLPAAEVFYFLVFNVLGIHAWIPNATLVLLGLCLAWLVIIISKKVVSGRTAFLPAVLFLAVSFHSQLGAAHDWFSILMVMAALSLIIDHITALGLVGAGALCGLATCFSQAQGISAEIGLAAFLVWTVFRKVLTWHDCRKAQTYLWVPFLTILVGFNAYFAFEAGIGRFLSDTVAFGFRDWPTATWNSLHAYMTPVPSLQEWFLLPGFIAWLAVYLLVPLIYILFFVRYWDEEKDLPYEPWDRVMLLWFVGLALFLGVVTAPTWVRLCTVSPPAIILLVWQFNFDGPLQKIRTAAVWAFALVLAIGLTTERRLQWRGYVTTPIGRVAVLDHVEFDEIHFLLQKTRPGDYEFGNNEFAYLLDLRDPAPVADVTASDRTLPGQVAGVVEGLKSHPVKYVFWSAALDSAHGSPSDPSHLGPLYSYLRSHYHIAKIFPNYDLIWELGPQPLPVFPAAVMPIASDSTQPSGSTHTSVP